MRKSFQIFAVCFLFLAGLLGAVHAEDVTFATFPRALGVQVGGIAGIGLSYQRWKEPWGYQFAAGTLYHPPIDDGHDVFNYNAGAQVCYTIFSDDFSTWLASRLYVLAGINHRGYKDAVETPPDSGTYVVGEFHPEFGLGGGVGVEAVFFKHFAVSTEMVYALFWKPIEPLANGQFAMEMLPQVSLRYRF